MDLTRNLISKIEEETNSIIKQLKKKFSSELISIIQIGSSLRPEEMFPNSDLDFVVIAKHKPKESFFSADSEFETDILAYSQYQFKRLLKEGNPIALMAIKFGKPVLVKKFKFDANTRPTELTIGTWTNNGLRLFNLAIMEYFARSCACCYLKSVHHSARSLLRAYILRNKGILCENTADMLENSPSNYVEIFKKLIKYRQNLDGFPFDFKPRIKKIKGKSAEPLLLLESLVRNIIYKLNGKRMYSLKEVINGINKPYNHLSSISLSDESDQYMISLVLNEAGKDMSYKPEMEFLEFPLYK